MFSRPKLAPTAKSRAVALARIGLSRCTPLREAEPILDQVTYLLAKVAARDLDLDLYRSRIGSFQRWVASGDFEEISSFVDGTKSAGPGFSLRIKKRQGSHVGAELVRTAETTGMLQKFGQLANIGDRSKPKILRNSYPIFSTDQVAEIVSGKQHDTRVFSYFSFPIVAGACPECNAYGSTMNNDPYSPFQV